MNKVYCAEKGDCGYQTLGTINKECKFSGVCDFQRPRNSQFYHNIDYPLRAESTCPYCNLPTSQCKGHTICKGEPNAKV